jgi:hypothetical protein
LHFYAFAFRVIIFFVVCIAFGFPLYVRPLQKQKSTYFSRSPPALRAGGEQKETHHQDTLIIAQNHEFVKCFYENALDFPFIM